MDAKGYVTGRNNFVNQNLGPEPYQMWQSNSGGRDYPPPEVQQQQQQWQQRYDSLVQQWEQSLPPEELASAKDALARQSDKFKKQFKLGKYASLAIIGGAAGGAALTGAGVIGAGGAGAAGAGAGAGAAGAGTSALEAQLIAGGMSAAEASSVAAEVAAATAAEGGVASGVGAAAAGGGAGAATTAATTAAAGGGGAAGGAGGAGGAMSNLGQLAAQYGPTALKVAGAALPLLAGTKAGGPGSSNGPTSTPNGVMGGTVLGPEGLKGTPAEMTAQSRQLAQTKADWANRPDQTDMYGNKTSWSTEAVLDPATGQMVNKWTNKIELDPQQQAAVNSEKNIKAGMMSNAEGLLGRAGDAVSQPMDWSKFQDWGAVPQGDAAERQRIEGMLFSRMNPEYDRQQSGLEARLQAKGLTRGSEQWNREMQTLGDQQSRGRYDAFQTAGNEIQNQYGRDLQSANYANTLRGSQVTEEQARRLQPTNEMNALRQGNQVDAPQFGKFGASASAGGVDYTGQYGDAYGGDQARRASTGKALTDIGTAIGSYYYGNQPTAAPAGVMNGGYNAKVGQPRTVAQ